jgi:hypothetical protein
MRARTQYGPQPPLTGICSVCGQRFKLRKDGTLWFHTRRKFACPGAGTLPKTGSAKRKWLPAERRNVRTVSGGAFESNRRSH